jgi:hypothetical protein
MSDNTDMPDAVLSPSRLLARLVYASINFSRSHIRDTLGTGVHPQWQDRMEICESCPLRVVKCGKSYCGKPLLQNIDREEHAEGCGCPTRAKARDPQAHCPRTRNYEPPTTTKQSCDCVWCEKLRLNQREARSVDEMNSATSLR